MRAAICRPAGWGGAAHACVCTHCDAVVVGTYITPQAGPLPLLLPPLPPPTAAHPLNPSAPAHVRCRVRETAKAAKDMGVRHIMNLGHGIMQVGCCLLVQCVCTSLACCHMPWKAHGRGIMQVGGGRAQRAVCSPCACCHTPAHCFAPRTCVPARKPLTLQVVGGFIHCRAPPRRTRPTSSRWPRSCATPTCETTACTARHSTKQLRAQHDAAGHAQLSAWQARLHEECTAGC